MSIKEIIKTTPQLKLVYALCRDIKMLGMMTESDSHYIKHRFENTLHYTPNLDYPKSFQEKLQWIKLHDRKSVYHTMVDKYDAKQFITDKLGDASYCIPTLGVYNSFEEINFNSLPNQFVLKCTFDSGSYCLCMDKNKFDKKKAKERLYANWKYDYYYYSREWPYKGLKHRIIIEPLISEPQELKEFKFFCFNGEPKLFQAISERNNIEQGPILQHFDLNCNLLDLQDAHYRSRQNKDIERVLPKSLNKMVDISRQLSKDTYFLRVDFYETPQGKIYVGELTFFESGGFVDFVPEEWNHRLGDWIKLPL